MPKRPECRILGPLEVVAEGRPIRLGGQRPQVLFATLALQPGQPVLTDRLAEAIWGEQLPTSLRAQLSIHVSSLRKAFATAGYDTVIETVPGGYRLSADGVLVDAHVVEEQVEQARSVAAGQDTAAALELYEQALAAWRGPAFAGLDSPVLDAAAVRFEQLRLATVEERTELALALHRHHAVVVELTAMVAQHPYRERLRGQLMLALARSGRTADALEVYREGRRTLVGDLGVEPGPDLRHLEQRILRGEEDVPTPWAASTVSAHPRAEERPPGVAVPTELPGDVVTFTGREGEVAELAELIGEGGGGPVVLTGPGGVGKSTLATRVAHRVAHRFPHGQLYVNLHGTATDTEPPPPADVLARFLRSLGVPAADVPTDEDAAVAEFRERTADSRLLLVLDDALDAAQVARLLPGGSSCAVLITSRRPLGTLPDTRHQRLAVLPADEAAELLGRIAGQARLADEPAAAAEVVRLCGRLPLALAIAGARLAARPTLSVAALAERLGDERRRFGELSVDDQDVRASFLVSYHDLRGTGAARMFRLLGLLLGPSVSLGVAAALAGVTEVEAVALLGELVDAQLTEAAPDGHYRLHDLLRLFARERAEAEDTEDERAEAVRRALHCYVATARTAAMVIAPQYRWRIELLGTPLTHEGSSLTTVEQVNEWIEAERENLLLAARQAATGPEPALAVEFAAALDMPLENRGRWREQVVLAEIVVEAARRTGEPHHLGLAYNDLGWALSALDRLDEALAPLNEALRMWRSIGHGVGEALSMHGYGVVCRALGRHDEALRSLRRAERLAHGMGDHGRRAMCQSAIGLTYQRLGRYEEAVAAHEKSVALAKEMGRWRTALIALGNLAEAYRLAGEHHAAVRTFREALSIGRAGDYADTYWEAEHLWGLGRALHDLGIGGRECWLAAAEILYDLGLIGPAERATIARDPIPETPGVIVGQL